MPDIVTIESVRAAVRKGAAFLLQQQQPNGRFEGLLSSSAFPTCAYAWVQLALDESPDNGLIEWLLRNQNLDGTWGLDAAHRPNRDATLFAKLILEQAHRQRPDPKIETAIARIPKRPLELALIKLSYAAFGQFDWNKLAISPKMLPVMRLTQRLLKAFPRLQFLLPPPRNVLPPVGLFRTPMFEDLFIAEQHTLVPAFILIELNTTNRPEVVDQLVSWLKTHMLSDNSWFRVNYITALSVLALIEHQKVRGDDKEIQTIIDRGLAWLAVTKNPDGGCREAFNLNTWDTALTVVALTDASASLGTSIGDSEGYNAIRRACRWLIENQNADGGWAFSGMGGDGGLPSDADDTALATFALLKSKTPEAKEASHRGLNWLKTHQGRDGSFSTYLPGRGDVGCVSLTAHAIQAMREVSDMEAEINRAARWLEIQITPQGYWSDVWLARNTYGTACAIMGLIAADKRESPVIAQGVRWLESVQNSDGGWGEDMFGNPTESTVEQTAWCAYALLHADRESSAARKGLAYLLDHQETGGSWEASCVGVYWEIIGGYVDPIYAQVFPLLALNQYMKANRE
jgi:squalene cyclase